MKKNGFRFVPSGISNRALSIIIVGHCTLGPASDIVGVVHRLTGGVVRQSEQNHRTITQNMHQNKYVFSIDLSLCGSGIYIFFFVKYK